MPSAAEEDAFYTATKTAANPPTYSGGSLCCIADGPPSAYAEYFNYDQGGGPYAQQEQRANNLQIFIKRGHTGRYLDAGLFYRTLISREFPHSDGTNPTDHTTNGFLWSSRSSEVNWATLPTAASANGGLVPTVYWSAQDYDHIWWHGALDYYGMTGDESIHDGLLAFKALYLSRNNYYWNAYNMTAERAHASLILHAAKFSELLAALGDSDAAGVLAMAENVYEGYLRPDLCVSDGTNVYPTGCNYPTPGDPNPGTNPHAYDTGQSQVWGGYYVGGNFTGNGPGGAWCGQGTGWRVYQQYMQAMVIDALMELQRAQGPSWTYYKEAGDRAFGIAQYMLLIGYSDDGSSNWYDLPSDNPSCSNSGNAGNTACHGTNVHKKFNGVAYNVYLDNAQLCPSGTASSYGYTLSDGSLYPWDVINYSMQTHFSGWRYYADVMGTLPAAQLRTFKMALQTLAEGPMLTNYDVGGYATGEVIKSIAEPSGLTLTSITPTVVETPAGSGTYNVSWTTPASASGTVRVKYSTSRKIVDWLGYDKYARTWVYNPATYIPWFAATPTSDIGAVPGTQSIQIATGTDGIDGSQF